MRSGNWKIVPVLSALVLATMVVPYAHAGCGLYSPVAHAASLQPQIASPQLYWRLLPQTTMTLPRRNPASSDFGNSI